VSAAVQEALEDFGLDGANDQAGGSQFVMMTADTLIEKTGARVARAIKDLWSVGARSGAWRFSGIVSIEVMPQPDRNFLVPGTALCVFELFN